MPRHIPISLVKKQIEKGFATVEVLNEITTTDPTDTTERTLTVSIPTGASIVKATLIALITAMNNAAIAEKIDIDVKGRKGVGGWNTYFSEDDCIGLGAVDGGTTSLVAVQNVSALVDDVGAYGFKCTITLSDAHSVNFTTQYVLVVVYEVS